MVCVILLCASFSFHNDDFYGALVCADAAALAIVVVDFGLSRSVQFDAGFGAVNPADLAAIAFGSVNFWSKSAP
jgi:hypothetical protein